MDNLTFRQNILLVEGLNVAHQSSYFAFTLLLLAYVFAMVSNIGLIFIISTEKNLHDPMHFLYCNLPLNDIIGTTVIMPRLLQDMLRETSERYITYVECVIQAYFVHVFAATCHYVLMIGLTLRLSHCRFKIENPFCDNASLFKLSCENVVINNVFGMIYTVIVACLSVLYIFITYVRIATTCITRKNKALNSKAIKTCTTHLAVYLIMLVSGFIFIILHRFPEYSDSRKLASIMFHIVPPGLNPLVYGLQTKEIRQKIVKLWCSPTCSSTMSVERPHFLKAAEAATPLVEWLLLPVGREGIACKVTTWSLKEVVGTLGTYPGRVLWMM
ncbi:putative olfactory receptor 5AK3 [Labeo rohita]|uniref:putative olfactory receptor 5AK3 n=1 Tax=Labeo rohita TaxID=84645 RepID=UPI0021E33ABF|nr:putative olfactory receptor 5AK3 [Labeo rohita]